MNPPIHLKNATILIAPVGQNDHTNAPLNNLPMPYSHMVQAKPNNTYDTFAYIC